MRWRDVWDAVFRPFWKEKIMNQEVVTFASMQDDHRQWDYECLKWRTDIERWQGEHEAALSDLAMLQEFVRQHGEALQCHADALEQRQRSLRDHDRAISEYAMQGRGERAQEKLAEAHREYVRHHDAQQNAHERIKKHHDTVMARLETLKVAIEAGM
jgi:hypothetical protein